MRGWRTGRGGQVSVDLEVRAEERAEAAPVVARPQAAYPKPRRGSVRTRRPRAWRKRLRDVVSVVVWLILLVGRTTGTVLHLAILRAAALVVSAGRRLVGLVDAAERMPVRRARAGRGRPRRRGRLVFGVVVAVVLATAFSDPLLRVAARPVSVRIDGTALPSLAQRSMVIAHDGSRLALLTDGENRRIVPLADIPPVVREAVLTAEDRRFWRHNGYDAEAIGRALWANLRARRVTEGASTITQQLAKHNYVGDDKSVLRKLKELLYAVALNQGFSKEELLERYLNEVYFGAGAYGVAAAAEEFFEADVKDLSVEQAALLAGLIRSPETLDPRGNPGAAVARRNDVLSAMAAQGRLSPEERDRAMAAPLVVAPSRPRVAVEPYLLEAVMGEFLANPVFGPTESDRRRLLLTGGLHIQTTLDPRLQEAAAASTEWVPGELSAAIVAVDPRSGAVRALYNGNADGTSRFDVGTKGRRQPGSAFKPLAAAAALEAGLPEWQMMVGDGPIELDDPGSGRPWRVENFDGARFGLVGLREAVVNSVNTAFAQLGKALGPGRIASVASRLGVDIDAALGAPGERGPAVALGGLARGVSPLELASAYGTFSAGGVRAAPYLIESVSGPDGQELYRRRSSAQVAVDPAVNAALVSMLQDAVEKGTGWRAQLPGWRPLGKTGTSEGGADAWFVGAVPVLSTAVWVGHPDSEQPLGGATGGTVAAPIWRTFMAEAVGELRPVAFPSTTATRSASRPLPLPQPRICEPVASCATTRPR